MNLAAYNAYPGIRPQRPGCRKTNVVPTSKLSLPSLTNSQVPTLRSDILSTKGRTRGDEGGDAPRPGFSVVQRNLALAVPDVRIRAGVDQRIEPVQLTCGRRIVEGCSTAAVPLVGIANQRHHQIPTDDSLVCLVNGRPIRSHPEPAEWIRTSGNQFHCDGRVAMEHSDV